MLLLLAACADPVPAPPSFDPVAVGFGYDGILTFDGRLTGYVGAGETYAPTLYEIFASEEYFWARDQQTRDNESCAAFGTFTPEALVPPEQIETWDGSALFFSTETTLPIEEHTCAGRADPVAWGEEAEKLVGAFAGTRLGFGIGPLTEQLRDSWSQETLAELGPSMLALWIALTDAEGAFVAGDWTTAIAYEVLGDEELVLVVDGDDSAELVPLVVEDLQPGDPLPSMYLRSIPIWYQDFSLLDFDRL